MVFDVVDQAQQRRQFPVATASGAYIVDEARRIGQVFGFAVAQTQASKDTGHLQMPLQAHPLHRAIKRAKVVVPTVMVEHPKGASSLPVANRYIQAKVFFPTDEGVSHQAGYVVGNRAIDRVLEVKNAQARLLGVPGHHQVAWHKVAVHKNHGRSQVTCHQQGEAGLKNLRLGWA